MALPRTLYGRLLLVFLAFGAVMTLALLVVMQVSHRVYHREADQMVGRELAQRYVDSNFLLGDVPLTGKTLHRALGKLSAANPELDIYLLDPRGRIVASSVPESLWARRSVDLAPVEAFLAGSGLPILGEDPRYRDARDIFAAKTVAIPECPATLLYLMLNSGEHAASTTRLRTMYAIGEGTGVVLLAAALAVTLSLFVLRLLTQRLGTLDRAMREFETDTRIALDVRGERVAGNPPGDEIDRLTAAFTRLSERVRSQLRALESVDSMRREVLTNVSHDLRTPLTTLHTHLESLALNEEAHSPSDRRELLGVAQTQTRRLIRLVEQLLEAAKLDAAQVTLQVEPFSLGELVIDVCQKFAAAAAERGVALDADVPPDLPWVVADIALIERVLDNLIDNGLRFSPPQGRVALCVVAKPGRVRLSITDTGPGIEPRDVARVFERFYRGDRGRSGGGAHAGLGLSIVKSILELHGTQIQVDGRPGRGAQFWFELPTEPPVQPASRRG